MEKIYFCGNDNETSELHKKAHIFLQQFNNLHIDDDNGKTELLKSNLNKFGNGSIIMQPFFCDIGKNISIGENVFINYHCTILDMTKVTIGNNVLIGPNVIISTASHSKCASERHNRNGWGQMVIIEDDVWIGAGAIILPNVVLAKGTIVGAGSVVTKSTSPYDIIAGNPAKLIGKAEK